MNDDGGFDPEAALQGMALKKTLEAWERLRQAVRELPAPISSCYGNMDTCDGAHYECGYCGSEPDPIESSKPEHLFAISWHKTNCLWRKLKEMVAG